MNKAEDLAFLNRKGKAILLKRVLIKKVIKGEEKNGII